MNILGWLFSPRARDCCTGTVAQDPRVVQALTGYATARRGVRQAVRDLREASAVQDQASIATKGSMERIITGEASSVSDKIGHAVSDITRRYREARNRDS